MVAVGSCHGKDQTRGADSLDGNASGHRGLRVGFALSLQIFGELAQVDLLVG